MAVQRAQRALPSPLDRAAPCDLQSEKNATISEKKVSRNDVYMVETNAL